MEKVGKYGSARARIAGRSQTEQSDSRRDPKYRNIYTQIYVHIPVTPLLGVETDVNTDAFHWPTCLLLGWIPLMRVQMHVAQTTYLLIFLLPILAT